MSNPLSESPYPNQKELSADQWSASEESRCKAAYQFCKRIINATAEHTVCYKPNAEFFKALGAYLLFNSNPNPNTNPNPNLNPKPNTNPNPNLNPFPNTNPNPNTNQHTLT